MLTLNCYHWTHAWKTNKLSALLLVKICIVPSLSLVLQALCGTARPTEVCLGCILHCPFSVPCYQPGLGGMTNAVRVNEQNPKIAQGHNVVLTLLRHDSGFAFATCKVLSSATGQLWQHCMQSMKPSRQMPPWWYRASVICAVCWKLWDLHFQSKFLQSK